jgi:K+ potassium transporter
MLNYAGQTAIVVGGAAAAGANPFFMLCPPALQFMLVALATVATIIASQSIISGAFSMTRAPDVGKSRTAIVCLDPHRHPERMPDLLCNQAQSCWRVLGCKARRPY